MGHEAEIRDRIVRGDLRGAWNIALRLLGVPLTARAHLSAVNERNAGASSEAAARSACTMGLVAVVRAARGEEYATIARLALDLLPGSRGAMSDLLGSADHVDAIEGVLRVLTGDDP